MAHLSNSGNKSQAKILIAATHLGLCASELRLTFNHGSKFQHCIYGNHVTNTTDTDFARDEHD